MLNKKQKVALCFALIFTAVILLSAVITAVEANHDCTGLDCPICKLITDINRLISVATATAVLIMSAVSARRVLHIVRAKAGSIYRTPVAEKVKLLN